MCGLPCVSRARPEPPSGRTRENTGLAKSKTSKTKVECPTCHKKVVPDDGYCPNCGSPIDLSTAATAPKPDDGAATTTSPSTVICPVCGTVSKTGEEFCPKCGAPLS